MLTVVSRSQGSAPPRFVSSGDPREALVPAVLGALICDDRGVPLSGRVAEYRALRAAGSFDASVGRLFEGHVNALQLVARFGTAAQLVRANRDAEAGALFGVWNTEPRDGLRMSHAADRIALTGRKTFCSGAGRVARAIVTAAPSEGPRRMVLAPMDAVQASVDRDSWHPLGMHDSESFSVSFDGVTVTADDLVGGPGDYESEPWFSAGASRFLAVQTGALEALIDELAEFVRGRGAEDDPIVVARFAECVVAVESAGLWVDACVRAWERFDAAAEPDIATERASELGEVVDAARMAVEAAALSTLERTERLAGARGLLESSPFARMIRDQRMYLRQPAPDAAVQRTGRAALARSRRSIR